MRALQPSRGGRELAPLSSGLRNFMSRFDDVFNDFERDFSMEPLWPSTNLASLGEFAPSVDIEESDEMYMISADLPGMKKDDVKIDISGNSLRISGERNREVKEEGYRERSYGRFSRSFTLPQNIDSKKVEANFEDGVLRIVLPKTEVSKAQSIKIESGRPAGLIDRFLHREKTVESTDKEESKH
ncbi:Hsp20/alpha crystallin family protein [Bdellovibrio sp. HCB337]|uniref:Hsp20/alpha crystallin family protein n=1 Tax=Bdellovibrio sp. HCB337 TaxID=3394358 RepID=UPI0039A61996